MPVCAFPWALPSCSRLCYTFTVTLRVLSTLSWPTDSSPQQVHQAEANVVGALPRGRAVRSEVPQEDSRGGGGPRVDLSTPARGEARIGPPVGAGQSRAETRRLNASHEAPAYPQCARVRRRMGRGFGVCCGASHGSGRTHQRRAAARHPPCLANEHRNGHGYKPTSFAPADFGGDRLPGGRSGPGGRPGGGCSSSPDESQSVAW